MHLKKSLRFLLFLFVFNFVCVFCVCIICVFLTRETQFSEKVQGDVREHIELALLQLGNTFLNDQWNDSGVY